jgi:hypothetical protein
MLDLLAQASVIAGFSRVGLTVRARLLPEFSAAPPSAAGRVVLITGATSGIGHAAAVPILKTSARCVHSRANSAPPVPGSTS